MKRFLGVIALICLAAMLAACSGGGDDDDLEPAGPLVINLVAASPNTGTGPLRVTFTGNISGGVAPYDYSWDFTNDGAFDRFQNDRFGTTVTTTNDYFLRVSDPGTSLYEAVLRVTDSEGTVVTSEPVDVTVADSNLSVDPVSSIAFTDTQNSDGSYEFKTGEPVYFQALVTGGEGPYTYAWDFNGDSQVDSTVASPQYVFTYNGEGARTFVVNLTVTDAGGASVLFDYIVIVEGPGDDGPGNTDFVVNVNASPAAGTNGVVVLEFDPTGSKAGVPLEPNLELSVVVSPDPDERGVPPYEYYWDFNSDGAIDSFFPSPTIPYYDSRLKTTVNPYLHSEDQRAYTLRVRVIDSAGNESIKEVDILSKNVENSDIDPIEVDLNYGVTGSGDPLLPYAQVAGPAAQTSITFDISLEGSTGNYQYQIDANGDGTDELPGDGTWVEFDGGSFTVPLTYNGMGYFPGNVSVRSVDGGGNQVDIVTLQTPISLVVYREVPISDGQLKQRHDTAVEGAWSVSPGGPNGQSLDSRTVIITGGAKGTAILRDVERVFETFALPGGPGLPESSLGVAAVAGLPMNQARRGHVIWASDPGNQGANAFFVHGGRNADNGILATAEFADESQPTPAWTLLGNISVGGLYPITDAAGRFDSGSGSFVFTGGVHPPFDSDADDISGLLIGYDPAFDVYGTAGPSMLTERYDSCSALVGGKLYIIGGRRASGDSVATVEAFDFATGLWQVQGLPPMKQARAGAACQVIGGNIYVMGGAFYPSDEGARQLLNTAEVFNPLTGVWSSTLPLPSATVNAGSAALPGPASVSGGGVGINTIWYVGGEGNSGEVNNLHEFSYFVTVTPP